MDKDSVPVEYYIKSLEEQLAQAQVFIAKLTAQLAFLKEVLEKISDIGSPPEDGVGTVGPS